MHILSALKGMIFTVALVILIFFLKVICPLDTGCLVDPFLYIVFSPLTLFQAVGLKEIINPAQEPFIILLFWAVFGSVVGALLTPFFMTKKQEKQEGN